MAGKTCVICAHPKRVEIESAIIDGVPNRAIGRSFGAGRDSIRRHAAHSAPLAQVVAEVAARANELRVEAAAQRELTVLEKLRVLTRAGEPAAVVKAEAGELDHLKALELEAKLSGELVKKVDVAVIAGRQLSPADTLAAMDRMRAELAAQVEDGEK